MFHKRILQKLLSSSKNKYYDNFDHEIRHGTQLEKFTVGRIAIEKMINPRFNILLLPSLNGEFFMDNIDKFEYLMPLLSDEESCSKYIELLVYKILGPTKVKLSLNNESFWNKRDATHTLEGGKSLLLPSGDNLFLYNLQDIGFDVNLYFIPNGIVVAFMLEQYAYKNIVQVECDDTVIDCGGCWGDTSLYFASKKAKHVYVFEFVESNLEVMKTNLALNQDLCKKISIIENPVWSRSDIDLSYTDSGPSSLVGAYDCYENKTKTLSIDDLVRIKNLQKVDFIKMDIEGAEIEALLGASKTIKSFKPKLAISVYHKADDLITIPKLIHELRNDYIFYLDYYTIISDEIVLYAI